MDRCRLNRRGFIGVLIAAPVAAIVAVKSKQLWCSMDIASGPDHTVITVNERQFYYRPTREQEKLLRHAYNYGMSPDKIKEVLGA